MEGTEHYIHNSFDVRRRMDAKKSLTFMDSTCGLFEDFIACSLPVYSKQFFKQHFYTQSNATRLKSALNET